jgi:hypothetical protein
MKKYQTLHLWMIVPMAIMQIGIFMDYWGDFTDNAWSVHIHYWVATIWYLFLILQPYYATHGQLPRHRTYGIIGFFLAGGVGIGALAMMYRDMQSAQSSMANPERFGPFEPWFFYGVAAVEIIMIGAFMFAVIQSILHRKQLENHAWWLVSTVFIIMMPALGRGVQFVQIALYGFSPDLDPVSGIFIACGAIILMALAAALKYGQLRHPATWVAVGINVLCCLVEPIGRSSAVQGLLEAVIRG